ARQAQLHQRQREAGRRRDDAEQAIAAAGLPDAGVDADALRNLRAQARRLAVVETELRQRRHEAANATAQAERSRARLVGDHGDRGDRVEHEVDAVRLATLDRVELDDVTALARQADRVRA